MRRFDRGHGNVRIHQHSLAGLLHADFRIPCLDYDALLKVTQSLTRSMQEVEKAFRVAVFNAIFHNRDDHAKNFTFLMNREGKWHFSPAYDLTWSNGPGGEHTTTYLGEGKQPTAQHFIKLAENAGIPAHKAKEIVCEVESGKEFLLKLAKQWGAKKLLKKFK
jgi:serine/threonine-protein kinase HipA